MPASKYSSILDIISMVTRRRLSPERLFLRRWLWLQLLLSLSLSLSLSLYELPCIRILLKTMLQGLVYV